MEKIARVGIGVIILKDNKILLGKRHSNPEKADSELHGEGSWSCPGGKLEFEENILDCAKREVLEEAGLKADKLKLISVTNDIAYGKHYITLGFLCENFDGEPKIMEPERMVEWRWFSLTELPKPLFIPTMKLIDNYLRGEIYKGD